MIPPWCHSLLVQIAEVFLLCKFCFGEKAPAQTKHSFASGVGSFQQLLYPSPHKDCKEAGLNQHEICLAQLHRSPPAFSQLNFTSICSRSIVECSNTYLQVPEIKNHSVGLSMAFMYLICLKLWQPLLRQKYLPCWRALWEAKAVHGCIQRGQPLLA